MTLKERIESFSELGELLGKASGGENSPKTAEIEDLINNEQYRNPWFTPENVRMAIKEIAGQITHENLLKWTGDYPGLDSKENKYNVGVVMAGNIPLVGFHDFLSVLISGNIIIAKSSPRDSRLIVYLADLLKEINSGFRDRIFFTEGLLKGFDMVIATGSDNTSRYFEYYFGKYPHIIRKNRNSVAVIEGDETAIELKNLGTDIFSYFGLGCRNVSKVFLPGGYNLSELITNWHEFENVINHHKYANNYDYNKAVYLVGRKRFTDTGYLLLTESPGLSSPVAVLFFEYYDSLPDVYRKTDAGNERIQCVVSRSRTKFGSAQSPHLWEYADGIDTLEFLLKKK